MLVGMGEQAPQEGCIRAAGGVQGEHGPQRGDRIGCRGEPAERRMRCGEVVLQLPDRARQAAARPFGEQEPGSNKEIADFCRLTYGVEFPMFAKTTVKGDKKNPFYAQLIAASETTPKWNFYKSLIDRSGKEVIAYSSFTDPDDKKMLAKIEEFLSRR